MLFDYERDTSLPKTFKVSHNILGSQLFSSLKQFKWEIEISERMLELRILQVVADNLVATIQDRIC